MSGTSENVLVVVGCGPGIGVATACLFAKHAFSKIALIARDARRLQKHRSTVIEAAARSDKQDVDVRYWDVDISNAAALNDALKDIENMGQVACVLFNAARVGPSKFFAFEEQDLIHDFQITNVALYTTAKWALPLLQRRGLEHPTLLVTNSVLWREPDPTVFALSAVKSSQRNLVQSLQEIYDDVHIALLYVAGVVTPEDRVRSPDLVAQRFLELYQQDKNSWSREMEI